MNAQFFVVAIVTVWALSIAVAGIAPGDANAYHRAVKANKLDRLRKLTVQDTSGLNHQGPGLQSPVMFAALQGNAEAVRILIDAGADLTVGEKDGYTVVHGAGFQGRADVLRVLHEKGVDLNDRNHRDGFTGLHRACWGQSPAHAQTVRVFLELGVDPNQKAADGRTCGEMSSNHATKQVLEAFFRDKEERQKQEL